MAVLDRYKATLQIQSLLLDRDVIASMGDLSQNDVGYSVSNKRDKSAKGKAGALRTVLDKWDAEALGDQPADDAWPDVIAAETAQADYLANGPTPENAFAALQSALADGGFIVNSPRDLKGKLPQILAAMAAEVAADKAAIDAAGNNLAALRDAIKQHVDTAQRQQTIQAEFTTLIFRTIAG